MKPIISILVFCGAGLIGCSQTHDTEAEKQPLSSLKPHITCGSMPPIKDKTKLIESLTNQGIVTVDMSQEQIDETVAAYIDKRQQAYTKKCKG
ncbi:hypothetical protein [Shewanella maritima]|uniref:hypothetical protein n=1 Tax=Shewanella maritima TaxID=2520507 RepID=UPI003735EC9C